jgi:NAD+ diphosphatase
MSETRIVFQGDRVWLHVSSMPEVQAEVVLRLPEGILVQRVAEEHPLPDGVEAVGLREAFARMEPEAWALAGRAYQWLEWAAGHRFCGGCATALEPGEGQGLHCPACGRIVFPSNATAIIVLIQRGTGPGREWALARSPHFKPGVYSAVAGFTEPGESLEQAVHREVAEELGIRIHHLRYFSSQPWPFPNGLMVGFRAEHLDGELNPDLTELEDARWFRKDNLPQLPSTLSLARWMLDAALAEGDRG